jgi:hypothetical protein
MILKPVLMLQIIPESGCLVFAGHGFGPSKNGLCRPPLLAVAAGL